MLDTLLLLIVGHFVGDFIFQSELMAEKKNPTKKFDVSKGTMYLPPWQYWMTAHCSVHGLFVGIITGNMWLGVAEFFLHGLIDYGKCHKKYNLHIDQGLHIACKLIWVLI